ncbi:MAG: efflux RND transporter periplasmic adaptor subunit [Epsilonproteobacteria bacterium]|nr:efflux RND transporter periplasmic adaptor subunit [Campylobacterota bacterium]
MKKILKIVIALIVVVALAAAGVKAVKDAKAKEASMPKAKIYPVVVSKLEPKVSHVTLSLPYLAEVQNDKDVKLASRIAARVVSIKPSGVKVKKGDVVVVLDTTNIKSALQSLKEELQATQIALQNLEATHKRTLELLAVQGASIEQSQKEQTQIATTRAKISSLKQKEIELKNNLSYAKITSPVDGVIAKTFVNKGALSAPGKPLVAISSKNGFYLMVRVPSDVTIRGVKFMSKTYTATPLESTYHGLNEYKVYVNDLKLISGDRVEVNVITFDQEATLLPFDAVLDRDGKSYVLVIQNDHAVPYAIDVIQRGEEGVVIAQNLEGKSIVVAKPDILLRLVSGYALKIKG